MQHTPGPWTPEQYGSTDDGRNIYSIEAPTGMVCESVFEEDAKLIAAAPKLADVLRRAYEGLPAGMQQSPMGWEILNTLKDAGILDTDSNG